MTKQPIHYQKRFFVICVQVLILVFFVQCKTNYQKMQHTISASQYQDNSKSIKYKKPPYLKKGDTIMIVAPAGFVLDSTELDPGIALAKSW